MFLIQYDSDFHAASNIVELVAKLNQLLVCYIQVSLNLSGYYIKRSIPSKHGEGRTNFLFYLFKIVRSIIEKLGHERTSKINIVGKEELEGSFYGQLVLGKGVSSSLDEQLAKEVKRAGEF